MAVHPDPAVLYPDIAERGSLGAALQALADEVGLSVRFAASDADACYRSCRGHWGRTCGVPPFIARRWLESTEARERSSMSAARSSDSSIS